MNFLVLLKAAYGVLFFLRENFVTHESHHSSRDLCLGSANAVCSDRELAFAFGSSEELVNVSKKMRTSVRLQGHRNTQGD